MLPTLCSVLLVGSHHITKAPKHTLYNRAFWFGRCRPDRNNLSKKKPTAMASADSKQDDIPLVYKANALRKNINSVQTFNKFNFRYTSVFFFVSFLLACIAFAFFCFSSCCCSRYLASETRAHMRKRNSFGFFTRSTLPKSSFLSLLFFACCCSLSSAVLSVLHFAMLHVFPGGNIAQRTA